MYCSRDRLRCVSYYFVRLPGISVLEDETESRQQTRGRIHRAALHIRSRTNPLLGHLRFGGGAAKALFQLRHRVLYLSRFFVAVRGTQSTGAIHRASRREMRTRA